MGITPLRFTGISQFSQDFQVIVDRTVQIASLPARALQNDQAVFLEKKSALANLRLPVAALAASLRALDTLGENRAISATSSEPAKVAVMLPGGVRPEPGSFTISDVSSLAQRTIVTSTAGQPTSSSGPVAGEGGYLQLAVGNETFDLTLAPDQDNLLGVRDAINASGAGVTASLINANGQVFLTLSANQTGAKAIELRTAPGEPASNLMSVTQAGADATFKLNGQTVTSSENYVEGAIPGAGLTLKSLTGEGETILIELSSTRAPLTSALKTFVSAYNQLNESLNLAGAGALRGESLVNDVRTRLRQAGGEFGLGAIRNLTELGISMDRQGVMSLDEAAFNALPASRLEDVFAFLRASESGLSSLAPRFEEFSDPLEGSIANQIRSYDDSDARIQKQIEIIIERVTSTQATLLSRLQAADALLAQLEGQQSLLDASIKSLQFTMYGRQER
jgi:flagellar hook-associated protein 2